MAKKTVVLVVLDGWGIGQNNESNPIYVVKPQTFEALRRDYPMTSLQASGISVGLPWGEVGNSEVGHLTLGAGKVLYQYYPKITMAIQDGTFFDNQVLKNAIDHAKKNNCAINFVGLLTKANVHAALTHLTALIKMARDSQVPKINLHLFADGKDSPPRTLQTFLKEVPKENLASLIGRYFAMDRNGNWRLTETAYQTLTGQAGQMIENPNSIALDAIIDETYKQNSTEEYLPPVRFGTATDDRKIKDGDAVVFFNYREDSIRQLASSFIVKNFDKFSTLKFENLFIATMSHYDDSFDVPVAFPADTADEPIGKVLSDLGLMQLRVAETYKYAHVTYFFNGLREAPFPGEYRTLIPSLSGVHPEEHPEMMASAITDRLIETIQSHGFDFVLANYANADAIAHTSDYAASLEAVRILDREIARLVAAATTPDAETVLIITGDHGNIEEMISPTTGLPESQHDASPVPFHLIAPEYKGHQFLNESTLDTEPIGSLADVAPTILRLLGVEPPATMTGQNLLDSLT